MVQVTDGFKMARQPGERDAYTRGVERVAADRVSKFVGASAEIEFQKAQAMEAALAGSPFVTPKVLDCRPREGRIEFEYIVGARRLQELIDEASATNRPDDVFVWNQAAGSLLGLLHRNLKMSHTTGWPVPQFLADDLQSFGSDTHVADDVCMHCDFSPVNVLVQEGNRLIVIDAAPNDYFTLRADLTGPRYVDLATYTAKLYWPFRIRTFTFKWRRLAGRLRNEFLAAYETSSGVVVDRKVLRAFERAVIRNFVHWKSKSPLIRAPAIAVGRFAMPSD